MKFEINKLLIELLEAIKADRLSIMPSNLFQDGYLIESPDENISIHAVTGCTEVYDPEQTAIMYKVINHVRLYQNPALNVTILKTESDYELAYSIIELCFDKIKLVSKTSALRELEKLNHKKATIIDVSDKIRKVEKQLIDNSKTIEDTSERLEYTDGLLDLLYESSLRQMLGKISESEIIAIANDLINKSNPNDIVYRNALFDFILLLSEQPD